MRTSTLAVLTATGMGLALTGCAADDGPGGSTATATPTAGSPSPAEPGPAGPIAACVVGDWRSTSVAGEAGGDLASARLSGGGDVAVTVGPTGAVTVDFSAMQPVEFAAEVAGARISGSFRYAGQATGSVSTDPSSTTTPTPTAPTGTTAPPTGATATGQPPATATPTAPAAPPAEPSTGIWRPVGDVDWADTRVTVDLTEPVTARPFDDVRIGDYVGGGAEQTGNVVDIDPLLNDGRYECRGEELLLTPDDDRGIAWTLVRAE